MEVTSLPMLRATPDLLRNGFQRASEDVRPSHPVQVMESHRLRNGWATKMNSVEKIYGKAAAMRLQTEKCIMETYKRMPGLPSSSVGLETIMGTDEVLNFEDVFTQPSESPDFEFRVHDAMEIKLGLL